MKASEDARTVYADIIDHAHHRSQTRPHMSLLERAAQFSAYDALAGYSDMIAEEARETDRQIVLDENAAALLNRKLGRLAEALEAGESPVLTFTVYVPDRRKAGGSYAELTEAAKRIDRDGQRIVFAAKNENAGSSKSIALSDVIAVHGPLVDGLD